MECRIFYCYAECHYAGCRYADCRGAEIQTLWLICPICKFQTKKCFITLVQVANL
jgi:hypothetical protein